MQEEKDMIEINLNAPKVPSIGKGFNYFGNISFTKNHGSGFPYGQYKNETENQSLATQKDNSKLYGLNLTDATERPDKLSCLRQLYCPDCQQRLDEDSVLLEKDKHGLCCVPLFSLNRVYQSYIKRTGNRRIYCRNCGGQMGYWKQA